MTTLASDRRAISAAVRIAQGRVRASYAPGARVAFWPPGVDWRPPTRLCVSDVALVVGAVRLEGEGTIEREVGEVRRPEGGRAEGAAEREAEEDALRERLCGIDAGEAKAFLGACVRCTQGGRQAKYDGARVCWWPRGVAWESPKALGKEDVERVVEGLQRFLDSGNGEGMGEVLEDDEDADGGILGEVDDVAGEIVEEVDEIYGEALESSDKEGGDVLEEAGKVDGAERQKVIDAKRPSRLCKSTHLSSGVVARAQALPATSVLDEGDDGVEGGGSIALQGDVGTGAVADVAVVALDNAKSASGSPQPATGSASTVVSMDSYDRAGSVFKAGCARGVGKAVSADSASRVGRSGRVRSPPRRSKRLSSPLLSQQTTAIDGDGDSLILPPQTAPPVLVAAVATAHPTAVLNGAGPKRSLCLSEVGAVMPESVVDVAANAFVRRSSVRLATPRQPRVRVAVNDELTSAMRKKPAPKTSTVAIGRIRKHRHVKASRLAPMMPRYRRVLEKEVTLVVPIGVQFQTKTLVDRRTAGGRRMKRVSARPIQAGDVLYCENQNGSPLLARNENQVVLARPRPLPEGAKGGMPVRRSRRSLVLQKRQILTSGEAAGSSLTLPSGVAVASLEETNDHFKRMGQTKAIHGGSRAPRRGDIIHANTRNQSPVVLKVKDEGCSDVGKRLPFATAAAEQEPKAKRKCGFRPRQVLGNVENHFPR